MSAPWGQPGVKELAQKVTRARAGRFAHLLVSCGLSYTKSFRANLARMLRTLLISGLGGEAKV
jgi:hypothetical protein